MTRLAVAAPSPAAADAATSIALADQNSVITQTLLPAAPAATEDAKEVAETS